MSVCICVYIYAFLDSSILGYYKILSKELYSGSLLAIYFIYDSVYILIPNLMCILKYNYDENLKETLGRQGGGGDWTKLHWISFERINMWE